MNNLYRFTAFNQQAFDAWGDERDAGEYCDYLNRNRQINLYSYVEITDTDEIAESDFHNRGFCLRDELQAIEAGL